MGSLRNIRGRRVVDDRLLLTVIMKNFLGGCNIRANIKTLQDIRCDLNVNLEDGKSPLTTVLGSYFFVDGLLDFKEWERAVEILLMKGADPNYVPSNGNSPLDIACHKVRGTQVRGTHETRNVELLFDYGADPETKNYKGNRLFDDILTDYVDSDLSLVLLFISHGVRMPERNMDILKRIVKTGNLPLLKLFVNDGNYKKSDFLEHGQDLVLGALNKAANRLDMLRFLIECGVDGIRILDVLDNHSNDGWGISAYMRSDLWESLPREMTQEIRKILRGK
jgi:hypothetical protein